MGVAEIIGCRCRKNAFIGLHYGGDQMQESVRGRFVITAGRAFVYVLRGIVRLHSLLHLREGFRERMLLQIEIGHLDMTPMGPFLIRQRLRFELLQEIIVGHIFTVAAVYDRRLIGQEAMNVSVRIETESR